jgi:hypothetical protein
MALLSKIRPPTKKAKSSKSPKHAESDKEEQVPAAAEAKDSTTTEASAPTKPAAVAPTEPPAAAPTELPAAASTEPATAVEETKAAPEEPAKPEEGKVKEEKGKDAEVPTKEKSASKMARRISTRFAGLADHFKKPKADATPSAAKVVGEHPPMIEQPEPVAPLTVVEEAAQAPSSSAATAPVPEEATAAPSAPVAAPVVVATA